MTGLWNSAVSEVRSWPRSRLFWWLMVLAPLLCFGTLSLVLGSGTLHKMPVVLLDQDRSPLSRELTRWIDATPSMKISALVTDPEEGNALLRSGKAYAFILIPRNFERDVLRKRPVRPIAWVEGQHMVTAGVLSRDFSELGLALWRKQDRTMRENSGVPASAAALQSSTISLDLRPIANPSTNYRLFLLPGMLPALLQICATIMAACVLAKLAREPSPVAPWKRITGALLPVVGWFWLLGCGISALMLLRGDLALLGSFSVIALAYLAFSLTSVSLAVLLFGITSDLMQTLSVVSAFSSPAFAFAGLTFPLASMPLLGRLWAALLPLTHLMNITIKCGQLGSPLSAQLPSFAALGLLFLFNTAIGLPLCARRLREESREAPSDSGDTPHQDAPTSESRVHGSLAPGLAPHPSSEGGQA